jgi:hypothetical protein
MMLRRKENVARSLGRCVAAWTGVVLAALISAAPALADGEAPPQPLSASTTDFIIAGIVVAVVVALAWLCLYLLAEARRAARRRDAAESDEH